VGEAWPDPVARVAEVLRTEGAQARLEAFLDPTPTALDAARAVGCTLGQIVKSLVFDCDGRAAVVMVPGDRRADAAKVARAAGAARARIAGVEQVEHATGFAPGAVAPFPLPRAVQVFIERTLLQHETVWIGAGSSRHLAALSPSELIRLSRATLIDAVAPKE
jgi:Cys-tRNA(Pro) deacylase